MGLKALFFDEKSRNDYLIISAAVYVFFMTLGTVFKGNNAILNQVMLYGGTPMLFVLFIEHLLKGKSGLSPESLRLAIFTLFIYQTRLYADDINLFDTAFRKILINFALFIMIDYFVSESGNINLYFTAVLLGCIVLCTYMNISPRKENSLIDYEGFVIETDIINNNGLGNYAVTGICAALFLYNSFKRIFIFKCFILGALGVFFLTIVGAASKAGFAGAFIATAGWVVFCLSSSSRDKLQFIGILFLFVLGGYFLSSYITDNTYLGERIKEVERIDEYYENDARGQLIEVGLQLFLDNPIFGVGLMQVAAHNDRGAYSHNEYVEIFANFGLVGAILYFPFLITIWQRISTNLKRFKTDLNITYNLNFMKVLMVVLLLRGMSCPLFTGLEEMMLFGTIGGYSLFCEKKALKINYQHHKLAS